MTEHCPPPYLTAESATELVAAAVALKKDRVGFFIDGHVVALSLAMLDAAPVVTSWTISGPLDRSLAVEMRTLIEERAKPLAAPDPATLN